MKTLSDRLSLVNNIISNVIGFADATSGEAAWEDYIKKLKKDFPVLDEEVRAYVNKLTEKYTNSFKAKDTDLLAGYSKESGENPDDYLAKKKKNDFSEYDRLIQIANNPQSEGFKNYRTILENARYFKGELALAKEKFLSQLRDKNKKRVTLENQLGIMATEAGKLIPYLDKNDTENIAKTNIYIEKINQALKDPNATTETLENIFSDKGTILSVLEIARKNKPSVDQVNNYNAMSPENKLAYLAGLKPNDDILNKIGGKDAQINSIINGLGLYKWQADELNKQISSIKTVAGAKDISSIVNSIANYKTANEIASKNSINSEIVIKEIALNPTKADEIVKKYTGKDPKEVEKIATANVKLSETEQKIKDIQDTIPKTIAAKTIQDKQIKKLEEEKAKLAPEAIGEGNYTTANKQYEDAKTRAAKIAERRAILERRKSTLGSIGYENYIKESQALNKEEQAIKKELEDSKALREKTFGEAKKLKGDGTLELSPEFKKAQSWTPEEIADIRKKAMYFATSGAVPLPIVEAKINEAIQAGRGYNIIEALKAESRKLDQEAKLKREVKAIDDNIKYFEEFKKQYAKDPRMIASVDKKLNELNEQKNKKISNIQIDDTEAIQKAAESAMAKPKEKNNTESIQKASETVVQKLDTANLEVDDTEAIKKSTESVQQTPPVQENKTEVNNEQIDKDRIQKWASTLIQYDQKDIADKLLSMPLKNAERLYYDTLEQIKRSLAKQTEELSQNPASAIYKKTDDEKKAQEESSKKLSGSGGPAALAKVYKERELSKNSVIKQQELNQIKASLNSFIANKIAKENQKNIILNIPEEQRSNGQRYNLIDLTNEISKLDKDIQEAQNKIPTFEQELANIKNQIGAQS